jgi:periplasmic protein TonB
MTTRFFPQRALLDEDPLPLPRTVWVVAALGALAIHAACGALAFHYLQRDADDDLGAPAIMIDVDLVSPRGDPTNLPVGPNTDAAAPSPAEVAQKAVVEQTDLPTAVPTETDDPYRVVSPTDSTRRKDDDAKIATLMAQPSEQSAATEATAVPTVESAVQSSRSTAPSLGTGNSAVRERVTWQKELAVHFDKFKRYPEDRAMQAAEVVVIFELDRMGHVVSSRVVKGSGDTAFDEAALAMLQRSDPVPPPPPLVADAGLTFTMPVIFHVKGQR